MKEEIGAENEKRKVEEMLMILGLKSEWRNKRVVINFKKAKAALDQLENMEVVPEKKNEDGDEEEDEEVISEEVLAIPHKSQTTKSKKTVKPNQPPPIVREVVSGKEKIEKP